MTEAKNHIIQGLNSPMLIPRPGDKIMGRDGVVGVVEAVIQDEILIRVTPKALQMIDVSVTTETLADKTAREVLSFLKERREAYKAEAANRKINLDEVLD